MKNELLFSFKIAIVPCSRFVWITNSSDHRRVWTANLLHTREASRLSGLGNYFVCKRFAVQNLLWLLELVIQTNLDNETIAVLNLARSWSILKHEIFFINSFMILSKFSELSSSRTPLSRSYGICKKDKTLRIIF